MASLNSGSSGSGALTQLIAQGAIDQYLSTNGASFTFFRVRFNKYTSFALEACSQPFSSQVAFGTESQLTLNRAGDLAYHMYVCVDLPGISAHDTTGESGFTGSQQFPYCPNACKPCKDNDEAFYEDYVDPEYFETSSEETREQLLETARNRYMREKYGSCTALAGCSDCYEECGETFAHWTNSIGQFIIRSARIVIGGSPIDTVYNDFMYAWEELSGRSGRRLREMVMKRSTRQQLICESRQRKVLYTPIPWWFCAHSGSALALASLAFHGVRVDVTFESLQNCIVVSGPNVAVKNCTTGTLLTPQDLTAWLDTTYVYLSNQERERFSTLSYEVLITQHQAHSITATNSQVSMQLNFNHPVSELIWMVRRKCQEKCNNWFNYSGIGSMDPVVSAALYLNNQARFAPKPGVYFRTVVPYQAHSALPDSFIYCYSFSLHPEDVSPSGSCNFSRIDHVDLRLQLQEGLGKEPVTVIVFARNYNILRFRDGLAGLAYAN